MSDLFPKTAKAIRDRIRRWERSLKSELKTGFVGNGYGKRYLLGPLYMLLGDVEGALRSFDWDEESFPDDCGDPYQYLTWALNFYRSGLRNEAFNKLYQTVLESPYLALHSLDQNPQPIEMWHGSNLAELGCPCEFDV